MQVSANAIQDITKLSTGVQRAEVALGALQEESLNPTQIAQLLQLAKRYESQVTNSAATEAAPGTSLEIPLAPKNGDPAFTMYQGLNEGILAKVRYMYKGEDVDHAKAEEVVKAGLADSGSGLRIFAEVTSADPSKPWRYNPTVGYDGPIKWDPAKKAWDAHADHD